LQFREVRLSARCPKGTLLLNHIIADRDAKDLFFQRKKSTFIHIKIILYYMNTILTSSCLTQASWPG